MDKTLLRERLEALQREHRLLDATITDHCVAGDLDELGLRRLKKRKLRLKDEIVRLACQLTPDIPA